MIFLLFIFSSFSFSALIHPENGADENAIHILFEWDQIPDISDYKLLVTSNDVTVLDATTSNHFYIDEVNIEWESTYSWQVCESNNIIFLEDNCEALGTIVSKEKTGNYGIASTFSFFVAHHMSTIEGGMVCTDDPDIAAQKIVDGLEKTGLLNNGELEDDELMAA